MWLLSNEVTSNQQACSMLLFCQLLTGHLGFIGWCGMNHRLQTPLYNCALQVQILQAFLVLMSGIACTPVRTSISAFNRCCHDMARPLCVYTYIYIYYILRIFVYHLTRGAPSLSNTPSKTFVGRDTLSQALVATWTPSLCAWTSWTGMHSPDTLWECHLESTKKVPGFPHGSF